MTYKTVRVGLVGLGVFALLLAGKVEANGLAVANVGVTIKDEGQRQANVVFDLSWANSWRGDENRDAAWVFVKFRAPGSNN